MDKMTKAYIRRIAKPQLVPTSSVMHYMAHHEIIHGSTFDKNGKEWPQVVAIMLVNPDDRQMVHYHVYSESRKDVERIMKMLPVKYRSWMRDNLLNDAGFHNPGQSPGCKGRNIEMRSTYSFEKPPWVRPPVFNPNAHTYVKVGGIPNSNRLGPYYKIKPKKEPEDQVPMPGNKLSKPAGDESILDPWGKRHTVGEVSDIQIDSALDVLMSYAEKQNALTPMQEWAEAIREGYEPPIR